MTREEFYKLTDILNSEVLGNFMHGGEASEVIAQYEETVEKSGILKEEPVSEDLEEVANDYGIRQGAELKPFAFKFFKAGAKWQREQDQSTIELAEDHAMFAGMEKMKEQMMAKAIDANCFGFQGAALFSFRLPSDKYLVGSKVKVIVIKND